jgi:glycine betaine/choline ABC-type transport system substrate-binding protein
MRPRRLALAIALGAVLATPGVAAAQLRLAAPEDCLTNPNCGVGLKASYGADVGPVFVPLRDADAGITALDDELADVAVAFSSNPDVSRPDVLQLRDDRNMVGGDHVVPVIRRGLLRAYGRKARRDIRRRLDAASRELSTLDLRRLNQQLGDGRSPAAVGADFVDDNGLGGDGRRKRGPRITVGAMDFAENVMLAQLYAEALRSRGYRVRVRAVGGLRQQAVSAMRRDRIDVWPGYSGSLREYLARGSKAGLGLLLRRIGARPLRLAPGENKNVFVMKRDRAAALGITTLSQAAAQWPAAAGG